MTYLIILMKGSGKFLMCSGYCNEKSGKSSSLFTWYHHRLWGSLEQEMIKIWVTHFEKTPVHFSVDRHALTITFLYLHLGSHSSPWSQNERSLVKKTTRSYHNYRSYFPTQLSKRKNGTWYRNHLITFALWQLRGCLEPLSTTDNLWKLIYATWYWKAVRTSQGSIFIFEAYATIF